MECIKMTCWNRCCIRPRISLLMRTNIQGGYMINEYHNFSRSTKASRIYPYFIQSLLSWLKVSIYLIETRLQKEIWINLWDFQAFFRYSKAYFHEERRKKIRAIVCVCIYTRDRIFENWILWKKFFLGSSQTMQSRQKMQQRKLKVLKTLKASPASTNSSLSLSFVRSIHRGRKRYSHRRRFINNYSSPSRD